MARDRSPRGETTGAARARSTAAARTGPRRALAWTVALAVVLAALGVPSALFAQGEATGPGGAAGPPTTTSTTTTTTSAQTTTTTTTTTTTAPAPSNPCARTALHLRCPDLVMSAPSEVHLDRSTIHGRVLLRATSSVNNRGVGPIELRAHRAAHGWVVYQAIYDRRGHAHLFHSDAQLVYKYVPGERYGHGYVEPASYWKIRHVAAFQLWSLDARLRPVQLVRSGPKVDYCLRDLSLTQPSYRAPRLPVYPACSRGAGIARDVLGTSVGWSDIYPYGYPEQWIDVTGLRGSFAFVQIANPDGLWHETSVANNVSETFVSLPSGRILGTRVGVPAP
jgi:hypothetical protein